MQKTKLKKTLTKKSEILQEALKHLSPVQSNWDTEQKNQKFEYICHAIGFVVNPNKSYSESHELHRYIENQLSPRLSLKSWLGEVHGICYDEMSKNKGRKLQEHRRQWVLKMIEEFKAQGD